MTLTTFRRHGLWRNASSNVLTSALEAMALCLDCSPSTRAPNTIVLQQSLETSALWPMITIPSVGRVVPRDQHTYSIFVHAVASPVLLFLSIEHQRAILEASRMASGG